MDNIEKSILEKVLSFEDMILEKRKEEAKETILKKGVSLASQEFFLINSVILGFSLGRLVSAILVSDVKLGFFQALILIIASLISSKYIYSFINRSKVKEKIKKEIYELKTLKEFKNYFLYVKNKYNNHNLLFNVENLNIIQENNKKLENQDMKGLINRLDSNELDFIKELLKKHSQKKNFSINLIDDIKKLCQKQKINKRKEDQLMSNLKEIKDNFTDEDDLLKAILEECDISSKKEEEIEKEKKKINFKKIL